MSVLRDQAVLLGSLAHFFLLRDLLVLKARHSFGMNVELLFGAGETHGGGAGSGWNRIAVCLRIWIWELDVGLSLSL